ncbi:hypothetical protein D9M72_532030 [compost metagenome]
MGGCDDECLSGGDLHQVEHAVDRARNGRDDRRREQRLELFGRLAERAATDDDGLGAIQFNTLTDGVAEGFQQALGVGGERERVA